MSKNEVDPTKNKLLWKWSKGAATSLAELGDPASTNNFLLCIYDGTDTPVFGLSIPAGGMCGTKPCWKASEKGYVYKNKNGMPKLAKLIVGSQADGAAKFSIQAPGADLSALALPLTMPVRALLVNDENSSTWCATYGAPAISAPLSTTEWKDKND